jgi:hypothetical protein
MTVAPLPPLPDTLTPEMISHLAQEVAMLHISPRRVIQERDIIPVSKEGAAALALRHLTLPKDTDANRLLGRHLAEQAAAEYRKSGCRGL